MSRTHRIFPHKEKEQPKNSSSSPSHPNLDPFHKNYNLTTLIDHIDDTLNCLITTKK